MAFTELSKFSLMWPIWLAGVGLVGLVLVGVDRDASGHVDVGDSIRGFGRERGCAAATNSSA